MLLYIIGLTQSILGVFGLHVMPKACILQSIYHVMRMSVTYIYVDTSNHYSNIIESTSVAD